MNDWFSVEDSGDELRMSGPMLSGTRSGSDTLTPKQAAEYLWKRVIAHLERSSR